jgi:hypothetical protein
MSALYPMLVLLVSCSHRSAISREELQSIIRSSISFAVEAETSLDYVAQGRSTRNFAAGHLHYIADELNERVSQLKESSPSPNDEQALKNTQRNIEALATELTAASSETNDSNVISAVKQQIIVIRRALEETSASL